MDKQEDPGASKQMTSPELRPLSSRLNVAIRSFFLAERQTPSPDMIFMVAVRVFIGSQHSPGIAADNRAHLNSKSRLGLYTDSCVISWPSSREAVGGDRVCLRVRKG